MVSTGLLHPFGAVLADEGVSLEEVLQEAEIPSALYEAREGRISGQTAGTFLRAALRRTKHPALGLAAARRFDLAQLHLLEYFAASSASVEEGLQTLIRNQGLASDATTLHLRQYGEDSLLEYAPIVSSVPRCLIEYVVGGLALVCLRTLGHSRPRFRGGAWVWFAYPAPKSADAYFEFFGDHLRFDAPAHGILIPKAALRRPLARSNAQVQQMLEPQVRDLLHRQPTNPSVADQVRAIATDALVGGETSLGKVAAQLHMSASTLKRRLAAEGTSYSELLDGLRKSLSLHYLRRPELSLGEVAYRVGYEDLTAFHKAFKRWLGQSPSEYRSRARTE
jgi:AraC-like DNA-binding protein